MDVREANALGKEMIAQHLPGSDWVLRWDRADWRAGATDFDRGRIILSVTAVEQYEDFQVEQLMLHEIAHVIAGPRTDHGKEWKAAGRELGYEGGVHCDNFEERSKGISAGGLAALAALIIPLFTIMPPLGIAAVAAVGVYAIVKTKQQFNSVEKNIGLEMDENGEWV